MKYPKIQSLYKRQFTEKDPVTGELLFLDKGRSGNPLIIGDHSEPEFSSIKMWSVDEKVDGTNIRVMYSEGKVTFGGRTDNAQIPTSLLKYLQDTFTLDLLEKTFPRNEIVERPCITLFGEGYGPKIQSAGSNYRKDPGFILFDVTIGGWWLKRDDMAGIAEKFGISVVPPIGLMTEGEIIELVKSKPLSQCSINPQMIEGVVCRSYPLMLFRNGLPIMWKLKCRDFS
jgi:ATP-dependent RNA circularization protein (DNA/RNA ligase family)